MKTKISGLMVVILAMAFGMGHAWPWSAEAKTPYEIKQSARQASVQPVFYIPILKVSFTKPLEEKEDVECLSKEEFERLLNEKMSEALSDDGLIKQEIDRAIEKEMSERDTDKYKSSMTDIDVYGYKSPTRKFVPLGALAPEWAKFPDRVIVVSEIKEEEISIWEKEYEKDILTISETAGVSPSSAKEIITNLRNAGYQVLRETEETTESVKLLWFSSGWSDKYPRDLGWSVEVEGTERNIIVGYQSGGILEVATIPEGKRVHVKAGYFDLLDQYKPKSLDVKSLEAREKSLERQLKDAAKERERIEKEYVEYKKEVEEKEKTKRDISKVTWLDLVLGSVKIEQFWAISAASGVFLGNMDSRSEFVGIQSAWVDVHAVTGTKKAAILTNAHVASAAISYEIYVSEDKEVMWVLFPAYCSMRFTKDSDSVGSPAQLLFIDYKPVMSWDVDTAIMVTTEVPEYEGFRAELGNSDLVKEGDPIISVGNPGMMQKFLTQGIVSRVDYSFLNSLTMGWWINKIPSLSAYNWIANSSFWYDAPIGIGGTSGSGIWAMEGPEAGKVIALHNMGLAQPLGIAGVKSDSNEFDPKSLGGDDEILLKTYLRDKRDVIFSDFPFQKAEFVYDVEKFAEDNEGFAMAMKSHGLWVSVAGMNGAVPINKVKRFLQERGLSPSDFGWEGVDESYWTQ